MSLPVIKLFCLGSLKERSFLFHSSVSIIWKLLSWLASLGLAISFTVPSYPPTHLLNRCKLVIIFIWIRLRSRCWTVIHFVCSFFLPGTSTTCCRSKLKGLKLAIFSPIWMAHFFTMHILLIIILTCRLFIVLTFSSSLCHVQFLIRMLRLESTFKILKIPYASPQNLIGTECLLAILHILQSF